MKVICLFSVANNYDQPDNNLIAVFEDKPTLDELSKVLYSKKLAELNADDIVSVVDIFKGIDNYEVRIEDHNKDYRLETIKVGVKV